MSTIVFASDHAGFALKNQLLAYAKGLGHACVDVGTHAESSCDYPDFAHAGASKILAELTMPTAVLLEATAMISHAVTLRFGNIVRLTLADMAHLAAMTD